MNWDLDVAMGTQLYTTNTINNLPADYLRTRVVDGKDDIFYTINGVPYPLIQVTLAEYDWMVQTPGFMSYPQFYATNLSVSPPQILLWPPPSGQYPVTHRYQKQMPDIATPETSTTVPWFLNSQILIRWTAGLLMGLTGDQRQMEYMGDDEDRHPLGALSLLKKYLRNVSDREGAVKTVGLDRRRFGRNFDRLKNTKNIGWAILLSFMLLAPRAQAQLSQATVLADVNSMLTSCGTGCNTAATLRSLLNIIVAAEFQSQGVAGLTLTGTPTAGYVVSATGSTAASWAPTVQLPNAAPLSTVDLQTVVPVNGLYASGSGAIFQNCPLIGCIAGDHQQSALYLKATATRNNDIAEYMATFDCNLNSGSTGPSTGTFQDAKVCVFNAAVTGSSAGNQTWTMANDLVVQAGDTGMFKIGAEFDIQYVPALNTAAGARNVYNVLLAGLVTNPITAELAIGPASSVGHPAAHYGILYNGLYIADTADIELSGGAPVAININGLLPGSHSIATIQDFSTSPIGVWLRGTYSTAAIASPGFAVSGIGQVSSTIANAPAGGLIALAVSSTADLGVYFSNGNPSVTAANGSINLDTTGKLWVRTGGAWTQVTVP